MAIQEMIPLSGAARKYEFKSEASSSYTRYSGDTMDFYCINELTITWGEEYSAGVTGIKCAWSAHSDSTDTNSWTFTATTPWGTYSASSVGSVFPSLESIKVTMGVDTELMGTCASATLSSDEIKIYYDDGGGWTLLHTFTTVTNTTSSYDLRMNRLRLYCRGYYNPSSEPDENACDPAGYASQGTPQREAYVLVGPAGYRYDLGLGGGWVSDDIAFIEPSTPSGTTCDLCTYTWPYPTGTTSFAVAMAGRERVYNSKTSLGDQTTHCPPGQTEVQPAITEVWSLAGYHERYSMDVDVMPKTGGVLRYHNYAYLNCLTDDELVESDATGTYTVCGVIRLAKYWSWLKYCCRVTQEGICIEPPGGGGGG